MSRDVSKTSRHEHEPQDTPRWARNISLLGVALTLTVILLGAGTRLMDAGLGCPDWPGCYGRLVVPDAGVAGLHMSGMPFEPTKAWAEMLHRYVASGLGILALLLTGLGWGRRRQPGYPWKITLTLLCAVLVQGAFGAFTVTLRLWPQVVMLHLLGGLTIMTLFLWLHLRLRYQDSNSPPVLHRPGILWCVVGCLLILQIALGGWTSSNYAGMACQGFPTCTTQWWPAMDWSEGFHLTQTIGPNYLHGQLHAEARTAIHVAHRLGALMLGLGIILLAWRYRQDHAWRKYTVILLLTYLLQATIGIANVLLWLPLGLALAHTAGAACLVLIVTLGIWRSATARHAGSIARVGPQAEIAHA
ncbi:COX15/CtaA family protein [Halomonas sp. WWR20]